MSNYWDDLREIERAEREKAPLKLRRPEPEPPDKLRDYREPEGAFKTEPDVV
jgi:hypothetical protein